MDLSNLDIHEFLASIGKHAVARATQGFSGSQPIQSKGSDIVFVEDTDECAQLSNGYGYAGREDKGISFGGWKARDNSSGWGAKKNETSPKFKDKAQPKYNRRLGEKEVTSSGWENRTWNDSKKEDKSVGGWDKSTQDGWDTGTQQKDDGWGDVDGCSQGRRQGTDRDTGWAKKEITWGGCQKGPQKGVGQRSSMQEREVSAPSGWEEGTQEEGIEKGWGNSINQENTGGCQDVKSPSGGWGRDVPDQGNEGWGEDKIAAAGWEKKIEVSAGSGWERGTQDEGSQDVWGNSKHQEKLEIGSQKKSTHSGWECMTGEEAEGGWGGETGGTAGVQRKEAKGVSGCWGKHSQKYDSYMQSDGRTLSEGSTGWRKQETGTANGWGGERKAASCRWGKGTQWEGTSDKWGYEKKGGWGGEKDGNPGRWRNGTQKERANCGWRGSTQDNNGAGWGKGTEGTAGGWGQCTQQEVQDDGWGESIHGNAESGWGEENDHTSFGWGKKSRAAGGWSKEPLGGQGGEKKSDPGGRMREKAGSGWRGTIQDNISAGWSEATEGTVGGWGQSTQDEADHGWASSVQKEVQQGWGEAKDSTCSGWTERKGVADELEKDAPSGCGGEKKVAPGRWRDGKLKERAISGWRGNAASSKNGIEKKWHSCSGAVTTTEDETKAEGSRASWEERTNDGWGKSMEKEVDSGWGEEKGSTTYGWEEERDGTACRRGEEGGGLGKGSLEKQATLGGGDKVAPGAEEKGSNNEAASNKRGSRTEKQINAGWAEATAEPNSAGWEQETRMETEDGWGQQKEVNVGQDFRNKGSGRSGRNAADSTESHGADKRRSGTFGPSGSNTVPLGKRKSFLKGSNREESETEDWAEVPANDHGVSSELKHQGSHQDGSQRWGKRFNHDHTGYGRRVDSALNNSQSHSGWSRLKALISLPEYSDMDELHKATNKILHHSGYQPGDRLNPDDESFVLEKVLAHHREKEAKLGCGVDYIMIDSHADHQVSCFWVVRKDGSKTDFSYWKCLEHLFEVTYPDAVSEVRKERGKDDSIVANVLTVEAEKKDHIEETKDAGPTVGRLEAEGKASRQEADDGW